MPARLAHARAIAAELAGVEGVRVVPDPPQTPMMHLLFDVPEDRFIDNARRLADDDGVWMWPKPMPTDVPGRRALRAVGGPRDVPPGTHPGGRAAPGPLRLNGPAPAGPQSPGSSCQSSAAARSPTMR